MAERKEVIVCENKAAPKNGRWLEDQRGTWNTCESILRLNGA